MKVAVGNLQTECTSEEFQQIYPAISNDEAALESIAVTPLEAKASIVNEGFTPNGVSIIEPSTTYRPS